MSRTEITLMPALSPSVAIRRCFPSNTEGRELWERIGEDWPVGHDVLTALVRYLTTAIHKGDEPLVFQVLRSTVKHYRECATMRASARRDALHFGYFSALSAMPYVICQDILSTWEPGDPKPLSAWMRGRDLLCVQPQLRGRVGDERAETITRTIVHRQLASSIVSVGQRIASLPS